MEKRFKLWETAALLALCVSLCAGVWAQGRQREISDKLLRLHVVAVSDEPEEQEIKLQVRDAVLEYISPKLEKAENQAQARELIESELENIAQAAASASQGRGLTVSLRRESFPTVDYQGFSLPAGEYEALRIVLGSGQGHNWWCVVFPPVCLSAAEGEELESVMGRENYAVISGEEGYELRFRLLELWGQASQGLKELFGQ